MFGFLKKLLGGKETPTSTPVLNPDEPYCMGPESAGYLNALRSLQQLDPENPMLQTPMALAVLASNPSLSPAPRKVSISVPAPVVAPVRVPAPASKQDNGAAPARPALAPKTIAAPKVSGNTSPLQSSPLSITATKLSEETPVELMDDAELLSAFTALSSAIESGQHEVTKNIVFTPLTTPIDDEELDESEWG